MLEFFSYMGFWFIQDGARVDRSHKSIMVIPRVFGPNLITIDSKAKIEGRKDWPKYCHDFNPCDYSLWVLTKPIVYYSS